ncbi:MAG TPA: S9 family peptidase [Gemmatimonadaceae bacterium]|nr:S9 family peptidase [Gemmatimonadaceae bacterium]
MPLLPLLSALVVLVPPSHNARRFSDVSISPDGHLVAWVGPSPTDSTGTGAPGVVIVDRRRPNTALHTFGQANGIAWSPDSRALAFLGQNGALTLANVADGQSRVVATIPGAIHDARFSPDGKSIAVLYSRPEEIAFGPTQAAPRDTGVIGDLVDRQHLAVIDLAGGHLRVVTPADLYVYEYDWSPDSHRLVISAANGSGNNNWWTARLYAVPADSGTPTEIARPTTQIAVPRWSADGSEIAYIGGIMSDQGSTGGDVWVVAATGGTPRDLTSSATISPSDLAWSSSPHQLIVSAWASGASDIVSLDTKSGESRVLANIKGHVTGGAFVPSVSVSRDGQTVAATRESLSEPPEVWAGSPTHLEQLTHANAGVTPAYGRSESVEWKSDAFTVQGWLVYPADFKPGTRYPMIVQVHGGPAAAVGARWMAEQSTPAVFSRDGYFVFMPNPRGSYGQGEAFTRANVKDFGYGDLRDVMAGVDTVLRRFPVDSTRMGLTGWSYGGYMTMWGITQTNRFKAAVAGAGISNWLSYTGENGIDEWMLPYFGATVYDDPAVYAKSSPMNYIRQAHTPTLVVVGERDVECPAPQSFEFWRGLERNGVATQLVVYPDEGHGIRNPVHQRDLQDRTLRWFDQYLKAPAM